MGSWPAAGSRRPGRPQGAAAPVAPSGEPADVKSEWPCCLGPNGKPLWHRTEPIVSGLKQPAPPEIQYEKDGAILNESFDNKKMEAQLQRGLCDDFRLLGNRIVFIPDMHHEPGRGGAYFACTTDPADIRVLGNAFKPRAFAPGRLGVCGYELSILDAFADGFLFTRTGNGDVVCWDLRAR